MLTLLSFIVRWWLLKYIIVTLVHHIRPPSHYTLPHSRIPPQFISRPEGKSLYLRPLPTPIIALYLAAWQLRTASSLVNSTSASHLPCSSVLYIEAILPLCTSTCPLSCRLPGPHHSFTLLVYELFIHTVVSAAAISSRYIFLALATDGFDSPLSEFRS